MTWEPEKRAGFALAALLGDDGELLAAGPALAPELRQRLLDELSAARARKGDAIAAWLELLRPELGAAAHALPARARALLAPLCKPPLRQALLAAGTVPAARPGYAADRELLATLLRIARFAARGGAS
jgi:hypothetical protein